jgi:SPP1 gp7 family putative phage head morphogenesis protein
MPVFNTADDQARYALVPFDEAINYLGGKINQDTDKWDDLATPQEHDAAFVVAGMKGALLQDIRAEVEKAIRDGKSREDFKKDFKDIVDRRGWSSKQGNDWRASIVYQTNLRQAYGDGRCRQMSDPDVVGARPYRMWIHGDSRVPRPEHRAMNGKVFRHDHPIAQTRLPSGFGCKCTWVSLSERDMKRRGLSVESGITWGSEIETAKGRKVLQIDRGFGAACKFESEREKEERKAGARKQILGRMPPDIQRDAKREIALALAIAIPIAILGAFAFLNIGVTGVSTSISVATSASAAANLANRILDNGFFVDVEVLPPEMVKAYRKRKSLESAPIDVVSTEMRKDMQSEATKYLDGQLQKKAMEGVSNRLAIAQSKKALLLPPGAGDVSQGEIEFEKLPDVTQTIPNDRALTI